MTRQGATESSSKICWTRQGNYYARGVLPLAFLWFLCYLILYAFHIGLFRSFDEAKNTELHYRKAVVGFKDCKCDAEITEVSVVGELADAACVYRYTGWNENEDFDEVDIIESDCYVDYTQAENDCREAQTVLQRKNWALNRHIIGQCDWQEGFIRCRS